MFKVFMIILIGLAIWGGVSGAFNIADNEGSVSIDVDKSKVVDSIITGAQKAKSVMNNIDKISTEE